MREILFRGKPVMPTDLDVLPEYHKWVKDGWVYGYLIGKNVIVGEIIDFEEDYFNTEFWCGVKPETVGQYTGLNDKNDKKMFEDDIVRVKYRQNEIITCYVKFCTFGFYFIEQKYFNKNKMPDVILPLGIGEHEIIGDIHSNPELLRSETDA